MNKKDLQRKSKEELRKISLEKNKKGVATLDALQAQEHLNHCLETYIISNRNYINHKKHTTEKSY